MMTLIISFTYHDCVLVPGWAADSPPPRRRTWSWSWSRRSCGRPVRGPRSGPASAPRHSWLIDCVRGKHHEILIWSERVCRWHLSDTYFLIDDHCTATLLLCRCAVLRIRDDKKHHTGAHVNPIVFSTGSLVRTGMRAEPPYRSSSSPYSPSHSRPGPRGPRHSYRWLFRL